ncbi:O-phosphoseryl-tRNA(Sec) selenium transferase [Tieghemostelium lacteum]|uniref:O-phosphoseryl-tRNA(Sec) selenium transferase n=1 Tax=Tieghemostelium lacteum TaxID=361077 RepID=A0A152A322_TIELA|nr:O-phosphoseryl-tRNA(Sec) selenium transferase [Tieghemostelium lacteum]|eukprot:KYR00610.1 O-phosphoseryl-tRNA(Sec) selenium transferase [Tieghemostelium lacteum]
MNSKNLELCKGLIKSSYVDLATQATNQFNKLLEILLIQRRLPDEGWDDLSIETFLHQVALMDSNNFIENIGVGEREGRVYSGLVEKRHFSLSHGIGRSGDINEQQPKAAGSSLLQKLLKYLVSDAMRLSGLETTTFSSLLVLPLATGMTIALTLLTLSKKKPQARYVIFPRIDQKSCLKSICTANLIPVVVDGRLDGDSIKTDLEAIRLKITEIGADNILGILSTTSCFAPRVPDSVVELSQLCKEFQLCHVINNAYGLQCTKISHLINQACRLGRVDAFVQSTDKNFQVPVGGAIVASPNSDVIDQISKNYPGRASGSPQLDLVITLLSMGKKGWVNLLESRKQLLPYFIESLSKLALKHNQRVLITKDNKISVGLTLASAPLVDATVNSSSATKITMIGSQLYSRQCSGSRVVEINNQKKNISSIDFLNYGSHIDHYPFSYLTVACAIGIQKEEIDLFIERLDKLFLENNKKSTD